jgi:serine/threonine protein phosphatase 1
MAIKVAFAPPKNGWLTRLLGQQMRRPRLVEGKRIFAIGDIHGRRDLLDQLLKQIAEHQKVSPADDTIVFLGDYVDRGSDTKGVIDLILSLPSIWNMVFLRGNHDQSLLDFLDDPLRYRAWRNFGAPETLLSYGVRPPRFDDANEFARARNELNRACPSSHLKFLNSLKLLYEDGDYLFVHAGIRPGIAIGQQSDEDLMWIRDDFLMSDRLFDKVVVHGHTPTEKPVRRPNRLGLDTGAHATGRLTAAILEGDKVSFLSTGLETRNAA